MKTKLPKPFYTARVGEALSSLTNYVSEACRIAEEIKPVLSADSALRLDPAAIPQGPKLLKFEALEKVEEIENIEKIFNADLVEIKTKRPKDFLAVALRGENLDNVESFAFIPAGNLGDGSYATEDVYVYKSFLVAAVKRKAGKVGLPSGAYHVWVQDSYGQEDLLFDAVKI